MTKGQLLGKFLRKTFIENGWIEERAAIFRVIYFFEDLSDKEFDAILTLVDKKENNND